MFTWLKNATIAKKLTVGFSFVIVLNLLTGFFGVLNLLSLSNAEQKMYQNQMMGETYISNMLEEFMTIRVNARDLYIYAEQDRTAYYDAITESFEKIDSDLSNLASTLSSGQLESYNNLRDAYSHYIGTVDDIVTVSKSNAAAAVLLDTIVAGKAIGNDTQKTFEDFAELIKTTAALQVSADKENALRTVYIMIGITGVSLVLAVILVRSITGLVAKPIRKIADFSAMLAVGDLHVEKIIDQKDLELKNRQDEIGMLASAFNKLIASTKEQAQTVNEVAEGDLTASFKIRSANDVIGNSLSDVVQRLNTLVWGIHVSAEQVASGAKIVSDSSISLSQGATEQAASIEELTASVNEITEHSLKTAEAVRQASNLADETKNRASFERNQMNKMIEAMQQISTCANGVSRIIKVIDDIAFQTNILALNAAVEAARAGQHGKGFAVVADEVRALATKSAAAVQDSIDMIQKSIDSVKVGSEIAEATHQALEGITGQSEKTAVLISSVMESVNEQTLSIEQINQSIGQFEQVVQTIAATAEESAAASEELSSQAEQLLQNVSYFKTTGNSVYNHGKTESTQRQERFAAAGHHIIPLRLPETV